jgi:hypothetical protein
MPRVVLARRVLDVTLARRALAAALARRLIARWVLSRWVRARQVLAAAPELGVLVVAACGWCLQEVDVTIEGSNQTSTGRCGGEGRDFRSYPHRTSWMRGISGRCMLGARKLGAC